MSEIIDEIASAIEQTIGGEWHHKVMMLGMSSKHLNFEIDDKEYVLILNEITDGHHWSEFWGRYER